MLAYWLIFSIFAIGAIASPWQTSINRSGSIGPAILAAVVVLALFIGLRYQVGGDWWPYLLTLDAVQGQPLGIALSLNDPGYMALNWLAVQFDFEIWFVNLVCAALFCLGLTIFCKEQPDPWLALVVSIPYLVIVVAMGYTRQGVAIGLIMAAIPAFEKQRFISFFCWALLASLFHKTAILILPLIALSTQRHRILIWSSAAVIGTLLFVFFVSEVLDILMKAYLDSPMESGGAGIRVAMNLVPALIFLVASGRFGFSAQGRAMWLVFAFVALIAVAGLASIEASTFLDRIALYLIPLQIAILSRLPTAFPWKGAPNILLSLTVIGYSGAILYIWIAYAENAFAWIPYQNYLFL